jgi:hypothetical protein
MQYARSAKQANLSFLEQLMRGRRPISLRNLIIKSKSFTIPDTVELLTTLRACVGLIKYLDYTGTPNVNQRLSNIVNDMKDQWNHGQAAWNAAHPNDPVFIGDFWSEWLQDYYPWVILFVTEYVQIGIDDMRRYWGVSTDDRAPAVLNVMASPKSQLGGLTINTANMN